MAPFFSYFFNFSTVVCIIFLFYAIFFIFKIKKYIKSEKMVLYRQSGVFHCIYVFSTHQIYLSQFYGKLFLEYIDYKFISGSRWYTF